MRRARAAAYFIFLDYRVGQWQRFKFSAVAAAGPLPRLPPPRPNYQCESVFHKLGRAVNRGVTVPVIESRWVTVSRSAPSGPDTGPGPGPGPCPGARARALTRTVLGTAST